MQLQVRRGHADSLRERVRETLQACQHTERAGTAQGTSGCLGSASTLTFLRRLTHKHIDTPGACKSNFVEFVSVLAEPRRSAVPCAVPILSVR